jgi:outer membrane protein OmpA-like peptidoglycan-associated protein
MKYYPVILSLFFVSNVVCQSSKDTLLEIYSGFVFFETNVSELSDENKSVIKYLCDTLPAARDKSFFIESHTDAVGNTEFNQKLSENRNLAVKNELIRNGIDSLYIKMIAYGEGKPMADNKTDEGKKLNRRSKISVRKNFRLKELKGKIQADSTDVHMAGTILVTSKLYIDSVGTDYEGNYSILVPENQKIRIDALISGYLAVSREIFTRDDAFSKPVVLNLLPIKIDQVLHLNEIKFVGDTNIVLNESIPALQSLVRQLYLNKNFCFEIAGHINQPGNYIKDGSKFELSTKRALKIYEHLIKSNIDPARMMYKGYGNAKMKFPNPKNETEAQENRRVEIIVRNCLDIKG